MVRSLRRGNEWFTGKGPLAFGIGQQVRVLWNATVRFYWDDCFSRAAALAYSTLFSLVPFIALSFSLFTAFRIEERQLEYILKTFLDQILPPIENNQLQEFHDQVFTYVQAFTNNVQAMNTVSIVVLVFSSVALLNTVESAMNVIWRVTSTSGLFAKLINFWAVISLGPLLIAVSIYYTTKFRTLAGAHFAGGEELFSLIRFFVPASVSWLALTILYYKLPAATVRLRDALWGGAIAAILFEFVKYAFAYYLGLSTTYNTIYGVLASVPLFLFWLYIAWVVVLLGAEISYQAGSIALHDTRRKYATDLGEVGALLGLRMLLYIGKNFLGGQPPPTESEIAIETGSDPELVRTCLDVLTEAKILGHTGKDATQRILLVSPDSLELRRVFETFSSQEVQRGKERGVPTVLVERFLAAARGGTQDVYTWTLEDLIKRGTDTEKLNTEKLTPENPTSEGLRPKLGVVRDQS